ncbi:hypothetical protein BKA81DRAFT_352807 [Phyllosticta paracitricarpa]
MDKQDKWPANETRRRKCVYTKRGEVKQSQRRTRTRKQRRRKSMSLSESPNAACPPAKESIHPPTMKSYEKERRRERDFAKETREREHEVGGITVRRKPKHPSTHKTHSLTLSSSGPPTLLRLFYACMHASVDTVVLSLCKAPWSPLPANDSLWRSLHRKPRPRPMPMPIPWPSMPTPLLP